MAKNKSHSSLSSKDRAASVPKPAKVHRRSAIGAHTKQNGEGPATAAELAAAPETVVAAVVENILSSAKENDCTPQNGDVTLSAVEHNTAPGTTAPGTKELVMESVSLTLAPKQPSKGNAVIYCLGRFNVRFNKAHFTGSAPTTIVVPGSGFAEPKGPKVKLTKEQRAALPKPTPAEKATAAAASAQRALARAQRLAKLAAAAQ